MLKGLEDMPRNRDPRCGRCGRPLVIDNDSGWEAFFIDKNGVQYSQKICTGCFHEMGQITEKAPGPSEKKQ